MKEARSGGLLAAHSMRAARIGLGAMALVLVTLPFAHTIAVRNIALGVALIAVLFAWRSLDVPRPPFLWFFASLALLAGVSLFWSVDAAYSRGELKPEILYPIINFLLMFAVCRDRSALAWCGIGVAFAIALSAGGPFTALFDWSAGRPQRGVLYGGAGFYSTWLVIVFPFALAAAVSGGLQKTRRRLALGLAVVALAAGYATLNRAFPYVAAAETLLVLGWAYARSARRNRVLWSGVAASTAAVLVAGVVLVQQDRQAALPKEGPEAVANMQRDVRWALWSEAVERISAHPLRGAGFGRGILRHELPARYGNTFLWHAHNLPLNWGLQMGVPGIALLLALFGAGLWQLARAYPIVGADMQPYVMAAMVMVIGIFLKNLTDDFFVRQTVLAFWAALGAVLGVAARTKRERSAAA